MGYFKSWSVPNKTAVALGFRSGFERDTFENLKARGVAVEYEDREVEYTPEPKKRVYHPDFTLPNAILIETKGRFVNADRQKMLAIKKQFPFLDIRIVFSNAQQTISKISKTTYGMWATKAGFPWADKVVPQSWLDEPVTKERQEALELYAKKPDPKRRKKKELPP